MMSDWADENRAGNGPVNLQRGRELLVSLFLSALSPAVCYMWGTAGSDNAAWLSWHFLCQENFVCQFICENSFRHTKQLACNFLKDSKIQSWFYVLSLCPLPFPLFLTTHHLDHPAGEASCRLGCGENMLFSYVHLAQSIIRFSFQKADKANKTIRLDFCCFCLFVFLRKIIKLYICGRYCILYMLV